MLTSARDAETKPRHKPHVQREIYRHRPGEHRQRGVCPPDGAQQRAVKII